MKPKPLDRRLETFLERIACLCLLSAVVALPLWLGGVTPWGTLLLRVLVNLSAMLWLTSAALKGWLELPNLPISLFASGYLLVTIISVNQSAYGYASQQTLLDTLSYWGAFFLAVGLSRTYSLRFFVSVLLILAALVGAYGLFQYFGYGITPQAFPNRISSSYYNPNHYAGFLAVVTPLSLVLMLQARHWVKRLALALLAILLTVNLALTFSWAAVAVGLVGLISLSVWLCFRPRFMVGMAVGAAILVTAGFAIGLYTEAGDTFIENLTPRTEALWVSLREPVEVSLKSREFIQSAAWSVATDHPWWGVGPGNFVYAYPLYRPERVTSTATALAHGLVEYAHSDYLHIASERGFLALGFYLLLVIGVLGRVFYRARAAPPSTLALGAGVTALLLHGLLDGNATIIPANTLLLWFSLGVLAAPEER